MKKFLVLYATREGQTEKIAKSIVNHLYDSKINVTLFNIIDSVDGERLLKGYDKLIFGASIHAGKIEKELAEFINHYADIIKLKSRSFFLVSLSAATKDEETRALSLVEIKQNLEGRLTVDFPELEMIAGSLSYTKYNWLMKRMMKRIAAKEGGDTDMSKDHEYTDWDQVEDYARRLEEN